MEVCIKVIPSSEHRYPTTGDWWWEDTRETPGGSRSDVNSSIPRPLLQIRVSAMDDWRSEMAVAFHELFEALACKHAGIDPKAVDAFDMAWESHNGYIDEGDDPKAPYFLQHQMALAAEQMLLATLGVGSADHEQKLNHAS